MCKLRILKIIYLCSRVVVNACLVRFYIYLIDIIVNC